MMGFIKRIILETLPKKNALHLIKKGGKTLKYFLFLIILYAVIVSCASQHSIIIPDDVPYISMCEIMENTEDFYGKDMVLKGKVTYTTLNDFFGLQCLHNSSHTIIVDSSSSDQKAEYSNILITAYGKLILKNETMILLAKDIEIDEMLKKSKDYDSGDRKGGSSGGSSCH